ncbi:MAG: tRNA pseudouridine(54/55) synthase Pus10, partial [Thermoplasmata archaeon]
IPPPDAATKVRRAVARTPLCTSCLGRLFAKVDTGLTNRERGRRAWESLDLEPSGPCWLCQGLMEEVPRFADIVAVTLEGWEFESFLVGSRVDPDVLNREEILWTELGLDTYEPIKAEINREVGKLLEARLGRPVEFQRPTVTAVVDTMMDHVDLQVAPLHLYGRYRKLASMPQTKWPCGECRGGGCATCEYRGTLYETSVEEVIAAAVMPRVEGEDHTFHGMGREDIEARMLGRGRPFVLEIRRPRRRALDYEAVENEVNRGGQVHVAELRPSSKEEVVAIKALRSEKSYGVRVRLGTAASLAKVQEAVAALTNKEIVQRTPTRVSHRRADKERVKRVVDAEVLRADGTEVELRIRAEAGTYIKELVHGDEGRTRPSLAALLETEAHVEGLDVLEVHDEGANGEGLEGPPAPDAKQVPETT